MRFYTTQHKFYGGIDLHVDWMYLGIIDADGEVRLHRNICTDPRAFLLAMKPFREDVVVCVECLFTWYWIANLCEDEGIPFVLGHALYRRAIHGGKAKNDRIDSHKSAALRRGGIIPHAYVYPRRMHATRDPLLRRRHYLMHKRAESMPRSPRGARPSRRVMARCTPAASTTIERRAGPSVPERPPAPVGPEGARAHWRGAPCLAREPSVGDEACQGRPTHAQAPLGPPLLADLGQRGSGLFGDEVAHMRQGGRVPERLMASGMRARGDGPGHSAPSEELLHTGLATPTEGGAGPLGAEPLSTGAANLVSHVE